MSIETARAYLKKWNRDGDIRELKVSTATVALAAEALGVAAGRIAKSISLYVKGGGAMLLTTSGDTRLDNRRFKDQFGFSPKMLSAEDVLRRTGHSVGGVCPFGLPKDVAVYLDESLKRFETIFPACGNSNAMIELTPDELNQYAQSRGWVSVCKLAEDDAA
ncbi:MAG: YbaK/EbsC family protein [Candidatus Adiutrix sp.]|jgi:prolyl-tRNA editing enzyme YbaK/EbsC (Cys-tRNA(Pro) deacylase)|nr:YbaK/EbsC family protein [Candidatus Adiutrix sp.]